MSQFPYNSDLLGEGVMVMESTGLGTAGECRNINSWVSFQIQVDRP
jgi:hypothetical protein